MAWQDQHGLGTRLGSLPPLIAGPILRQVTDSAVTVWVAMKRGYTVTLEVWASDSMLGTPIFTGSLATTALGDHLHVAAVTARANSAADSLSEGNVYFYNLTFAATDATLGKLTFSQALTPEGAHASAVTVKSVFGCGTYSQPSFVLAPKNIANIKLLHGSCRKPHAEGRDALAIVDDLIQQNFSSPLARPQQLLLTGDQIYADDVADGLLLMLTDAGDTLLGWSETVSLGSGKRSLRFSDWPSYYRVSILENAGFTSDDLKSHLMSLGEYLAMYLFVWSDVLWPPPANVPIFDDVEAAVVKPLSQYQSFATGIKAFIDDKDQPVAREIFYMNIFRDSLPQVRRALANIPTYMICDDHEVTDDWNMTRRFCRDVYGGPVGLRVVQNALVAFAVCQAWGNEPARFSTSPVTAGGTLLSKLAKVSATVGTPATAASTSAARDGAYAGVSADLRTLVGVHDGSTVLSKGRVFHDSEWALAAGAENQVSLRFDFRVEGKGHLILVTDTRTWRAYPKANIDSHADFLPSPAQLTTQVSANSGHPIGDRVLFVVLTTNAPPYASFRFAASHPLFVDTAAHIGVGRLFAAIYEEFAGPSHGGTYKDATGEVRAIYEDDLLDSWELDSNSPFDRLITQIDALVHNGSNRAILLSGDVHSSFASRLLVCDPQVQPPFGTGAGANAPLPSPWVPRFVVAQLVSSALRNQSEKTRGQQLEGYTYAPKEIARHPLPSHVPEELGGPALPGASGPSGYRLDYLVTDPGLSSAGGSSNSLTVNEGEDVANLRNYSDMSESKRKLKYSGASALQIVGHNNVAELTFAGSNVRHTLHWLGPTGPPFKATYDVSLDLNDTSYQLPV